ncbi:MAG TPA: OmpA family protein [Anaeromyxobacter sp.]|nr:OmpA family protein [Anaeromyxobacter sp.]
MRNVLLALVALALGCAANRAEVAPEPAGADRGTILRAPELARVRCLLVAPFENASDAPLAAEAATTALVSAVDPARTRVFPVADLRALFKDTSLELPQGIAPSLALELAELVGADAAVWGSVEGRSHAGSPELLVTVRAGLVADRRLLYAETGLVTPAAGEKTDAAVRKAALDLARPMLARLGDPGKKRCFDPERTRTVRRLALAEEHGGRRPATLAADGARAAAVPGAGATTPASAARAPAKEPRTPRQAEWAKKLGDGGRILVEDVAFAARTAALDRDAGLADLAAALLARPGVAVRLEGFVDATPDHGADQKLSAAMAQSAGKRLVELGVPKQQLTWAGRGGESPVLPNFTARGRAANRRIEAVAGP